MPPIRCAAALGPRRQPFHVTVPNAGWSVKARAGHIWHPARSLSDRQSDATTRSALGLLFLLLTERGSQDVAQAGAAVRGTELGHGLLLVLDLQRLDRQGQPAAGRVDIDDLG